MLGSRGPGIRSTGMAAAACVRSRSSSWTGASIRAPASASRGATELSAATCTESPATTRRATRCAKAASASPAPLASVPPPAAPGGAARRALTPEVAAEVVHQKLGAQVQLNVTAAAFAEHIRQHDPEILVFSGHGDVPLGQQNTLAFVHESGSGLEVVTPDSLAEVIGAHQPRLLFLNGCATEALGKRALREGVEHVVCWRTIVNLHA